MGFLRRVKNNVFVFSFILSFVFVAFLVSKFPILPDKSETTKVESTSIQSHVLKFHSRHVLERNESKFFCVLASGISTEDRVNIDPTRTRNGTLREEVDFLNFLIEPTGRCRKLISLGGYSCRKLKDGNKDICLDDYLWDSSRPCLIYSFGISTETSFEEDFLDFKICEVHLFDPTIKEKDLSKKLRSKLHHFHEFGISNSPMVMMVNNSNVGYRMLPFGTILDILDHRDRVIDYFKIDVEGSEWNTFQNMLSEDLFRNVNQLCVEIHLKELLKIQPRHKWLQILQEKYDLLSQLETIGGFRRISFQLNGAGGCSLHLKINSTDHYPLCGELLFIKDRSTIKQLR